MPEMPRVSAHTLAVRAGRPTGAGDPLSTPPILASAFLPGGAAHYARADNPTWVVLEQAVAQLEGGGVGLAFASGMGAIAAVAGLAGPGALVVAPRVAYGGTLALLGAWADERRIRLRQIRPDLTEMGTAMAAAGSTGAIHGAPLVWLELPANPTLELIDLAQACEVAHRAGALVAVDATFATPLGIRALDHGADVVVHSATKYLSGHSDLILGLAVTRDDGLAARLRTARTLGGAIPGPMEAWLALRGVRTFPLRFERACGTAAEIAGRCAKHPAISRVRHLSLPTDPGYELAARQLDSLGAIVSLEFVGGVEAAERLCATTRLWINVTSLGGLESTLERRRRWADESPDTPDDLVRLSVGIEDAGDLWADLRQALDALV